MIQESGIFKNSKKGKIIFITGILVSIYWILGQVIKVYDVAFLGALFEMLWLPALAMLFLLPILSMLLWVKEKFNPRSLYLYAILLICATVLFLLFA